MNITIRKANINDIKALTELTMFLYNSRDYNYLESENKTLLQDEKQAFFLAYDTKIISDTAIAFAHCSLRQDYVEGTTYSPVGYLEGIFVQPEYRNQGIAKKLTFACENFSKMMGCLEFASDCDIDNEDSFYFHLKIGFIEANRNIHFIKKLK